MWHSLNTCSDRYFDHFETNQKSAGSKVMSQGVVFIFFSDLDR